MQPLGEDERRALEKSDDVSRDWLKFCWDQYMKFYMSFLAINIAAIGALQYISAHRGFVAIVFIFQNIFTLTTSVLVGAFTESTRRRVKRKSMPD